MTDWITASHQIEADITAFRHALHAHPELGTREFETARLIRTFLTDLGIPFVCHGQNTIAEIVGAPGKTVALRADIDALPIREQTDAEFASRIDGIMHACGHDFHTAALLGVARLLVQHRDALQGKVILIFESDEEGNGSAAALSKLLPPDTSAVFGAHVSPDLPEGTFGFTSGAMYAASGMFDIVVHGQSCHAAEPHKGIDALRIAVGLCDRLYHFADDGAVITVGKLAAGTVRNIVSDRAELAGIVRCFGTERRRQIKETMAELIRQTADQSGAEIEFDFIDSYIGVTCPEGGTKLAESTAKSLGFATASVLPTMMTEDFGEFVAHRDGTFYHIGVGGEYALHSSRFCPDDRNLVNAMALMCAIVEQYINS